MQKDDWGLHEEQYEVFGAPAKRNDRHEGEPSDIV
jgi:hypothetical protein